MKKIVFILALMLVIFNTSAQNSSEKAKNIALKVMETMGGEKNWNNVQFIQWDFAKRKLYWNKWTGDVRIESPKDSLTILVNINTTQGKAYKNGNEITEPKTLKPLLEQGKKWWINDSYWFTMPWKLLDPGVNLKYIKTDNLPNGNKADVLEMTFENVGVTPENKYLIFVDQQEKLVKQWSYFKQYKDEKPKFTLAWNNYQKVGNVLLSFNRLNGTFGPKNIVVKNNFDQEIFTKL